jgi:putative ABC transport system permease protein
MRWLLRFLVSDADRRAIENDLAELYEVRRRQEGPRPALRWLRRQRLVYPLHLLADRLWAAVSDRVATLPHLWRDCSYSARSLARTPALAATIILTLAVALGATTAVIGVVRAVLLNPLPYSAPDELVWIYTDNPPFRFPFSVVDYRALEAEHPTFDTVAGYQTGSVTVTEGGVAERVTAKAVTGSYFPLLGEAALLGRVFDESDDRRNDRVAVLTHAYWVRRFGSDPTVLGRRITIEGASYAVIGVLQQTEGPLEHNVALFTAARWLAPTRKGPFFIRVLGRLRTGVSPAAALEALHATSRRLFPVWRSSYQDEKATWGMQELRARVVGDVGPTLVFVLAAVGCLLLIACANAVNLLIARALSRSRELAIRSALGASRGRLLQHLLSEGGVLTTGAALGGLGVALLSLRLVTLYGADYIPRVDEIRLSGPVLGWLAVLAALSGLLILAGGLVPAMHGSRFRADHALQSGGRGATEGPAARRLRRVLVAAEFALATPLIIAAVLVLASLQRLSRVPIGIDTGRIFTAAVSLPGARYAQGAEREMFWKRVRQGLAALPGVDAAAVADSRPPDESGNQNNFDLEDRPTPPGQNQPVCTWVAVSPEFFRAVGLPLERGRLLDERSLQENVVVVDEAWASRFFPGEDVLGRRFREGGCTTCPWTTVVGVVGNVRWTGLDAPEDGTVYWPFVDFSNAFLIVRTAGDPASLSLPARRVVQELDAGLAVSNAATGNELVADALATPRYVSVLIGLFGLAALVLAVVGIYGVMAYFVEQHTRDIGIRLALGGDPARVRRMIVLHGVRLVVAGVTVGLGTGFLASRLMTTVLFGVSPTDPGTMVGVPTVLVGVALVACLVPAHRAARVDPVETLRES